MSIGEVICNCTGMGCVMGVSFMIALLCFEIHIDGRYSGSLIWALGVGSYQNALNHNITHKCPVLCDTYRFTCICCKVLGHQF